MIAEFESRILALIDNMVDHASDDELFAEGDCHLVLLHGWGLNAQVWDCITPQLASHFTLHL
ncbi:YfcL family protein, partial [Klebsiella pneumoniae]|uniref:YfcL family protein n=1 Tax=Klebsiella pneumoniae TaxID=573 RepID=UPI00210BE1DD